jgi:hypothetical protein
VHLSGGQGAQNQEIQRAWQNFGRVGLSHRLSMEV